MRKRQTPDEPLVSILVANWNGKELLRTCLASLRRKTRYSNYNVIVIDNGSSDGSVQFVEENYPWVDLLILGRNYGFAVGNNRGMKYAIEKYEPRYILLLNSDTEIVQEDWLRLVEIAESDSRIGVVGCQLIYPNGIVQYIGTRFEVGGLKFLNAESCTQFPKVFEVDAVLGACFLIKKEVIDRIGMFDEGFSPFYHEESDYCLRAHNAGYRVCISSDVKVVHLGGKSMAKVNAEYLYYVFKKNEIRFMLLNFPVTWLSRRLRYEVNTLLYYCSKRTGVRLTSYVKAWFTNLISLKEILLRRRERKIKLVKESKHVSARQLA